MEEKKINVDDLNGVKDVTMKVITKTIQEPDPVKFSALCQALFLEIHEEVFICYSTTVIPMPTNRGIALVYIANLQYWATEEDHAKWLEDLKRSNLFIKP